MIILLNCTWFKAAKSDNWVKKLAPRANGRKTNSIVGVGFACREMPDENTLCHNFKRKTKEARG